MADFHYIAAVGAFNREMKYKLINSFEHCHDPFFELVAIYTLERRQKSNCINPPARIELIEKIGNL